MKDTTILKIKPNLADFTDDKEKNPCIVETAGFVPLEVKFKQFEQNGIRAQFNSSDFDSSDYREIYLSPNTTIYPDDDFEDVQEKLVLQETIKAKILNSKVVETESRSDEVQTTMNDNPKEVDDVKGNS